MKKLMECCKSPRGKGFAMLVLGALVLGNAYWVWLSWPLFIGWLLVLAGFLKMLMPKK
ncbi:MAG: hypothetical protein WC511_00440 [Candidatus Pacearchaeota archaeon]|jgi:uncharacterized membrane protein HdeD (DUF308 family)